MTQPASRQAPRPPVGLIDRPTACPSDRPSIVAVSRAMRRAVDLARRFAPLNLPVLLVGETGTGKEVLAQAIHCWSGRPGQLVDVDCGALPAGLAAAELFGHCRGAFTNAIDSVPGLLQAATRGTLFLDELASLSLEGQAALLRVLESGEVRRVGERAKQRIDIRLVAAVQVVVCGQGGGLRHDLYQRLAGGVIRLTPLRDRPEDLLPLARHLAAALGRGIIDSVSSILERHTWPGNVRELKHVVSRAAALTDDRDLGPSVVAEAVDLGLLDSCRAAAGLEDAAPAAERQALAALCRELGGSAPVVAAALGLHRSALYRRLKRLGLTLRGCR